MVSGVCRKLHFPLAFTPQSDTVLSETQVTFSSTEYWHTVGPVLEDWGFECCKA